MHDFSRIKAILVSAVFMMILLVGIAAAAPAESQTAPSVENPAAAPAPRAVFLQPTHTFDTVMEGTSIKHDFIVENHGTGTLIIKKVQPD